MFCFLLIPLLAVLQQAAPGEIKPVILVPGYGGSKLSAKLTNKPDKPNTLCEKNTKDFFNLWLNLEFITPTLRDCWADNIRLVYDNATRTTHSPEGVEVIVPGFGDPASVEEVNKNFPYYRALIKALCDEGLQRNINLRGAPYDFRKGPNENVKWFNDTKALIEETYKNTNNKRVVIISHSTGGLMVVKFFERVTQEWKDKYVAGYISCAAIYGGTIKTMEMYAIGNDLGSYAVNQELQREVQSTWPGLAFTGPSPWVFNQDEVFVKTSFAEYSLSNMDQFFKNLSCPDCWEIWKDILPYKKNISAPGVVTYCLYGTGVPTIQRLIPNKKDPNFGRPEIVNGDGDGTVPLRSLESCMRWNGTQKQNFYRIEFPEMNHMGVIQKDVAVKNIIEIIKDLKD